MKRDKAYLVRINKDSFRRYIPAEIIGVEIITPEDFEPRLCYHIMHSDMKEDWIPMRDTANYRIISFEDILNGDIPTSSY